ncbi:hypothetical protein LPJ66_004345 [Kickxella alabastrina]|uniref:Uncharacterized protein n=1 Tax=Kickxella alabastrina TaxID=61397 RepID=A0ACC1IHA3_9FUNG|nr:hypothetical protein LPJ66_004345 [Kickxella alabastrina]
MPPIDITRLIYAPGYGHIDPTGVTVIVERIVIDSGARKRAGKVATSSAIVIHETRNDLVAVIPAGHAQARHPCAGKQGYRIHRHQQGYHHGHHGHYNGHHGHHHGHHHGDQQDPEPKPEPGPEPGLEQRQRHIGHAHHAVPYGHSHRYQAQQQHLATHSSDGNSLGPRLADFALSELGFLALSFALSLVLLLLGYKIGDRVCRFENARDRTRGRGHRNSLARRQQSSGAWVPATQEKQQQQQRTKSLQPIYLEADSPNEMDIETEADCALSVVAEPHTARTKDNGGNINGN